MSEETLIHIGYVIVGIFIGYHIAVHQLNKIMDEHIAKKLKEAKRGTHI